MFLYCGQIVNLITITICLKDFKTATVKDSYGLIK